MFHGLFKLAGVLFVFSWLLIGCGGADLEDYIGGSHLVLKLESMDNPEMDRENAVATVNIIKDRLTKFAVHERIVKIQDDRYIIVQFPPNDKTERALKAISKPCVLEFKLVDETHDLKSAVSGNIPPGLELLYGLQRNSTTKKMEKTPFLVEKKALLSRPALEDAKPVMRYQQPTVYIELGEADAVAFERITAENIDRRLAVIVDSMVLSNPTISEKIPGGKIGVAGYFTKDASHDVALGLNTGPYPAGVSVVESRTVTKENFLGGAEK
ncbi:MAG: hypothetical protein GY859_02285 [Desulfobacterales bacterium]|nr:hypothetical protein [Desulfobacterales bacterium]